MRELLARITGVAAALQAALAWLPPTLARLVVGVIFVQSGLGKLENLERVEQFFRELGIPAAELQARFVAVTELACGALLLVGLAARFAAVPLVVILVVAMVTALRDRIGSLLELFAVNEFLWASLLAVVIALGAGPLSLDALVRRFSETQPQGGTDR
jgi:putative oxidoreductase